MDLKAFGNSAPYVFAATGQEVSERFGSDNEEVEVKNETLRPWVPVLVGVLSGFLTSCGSSSTSPSSTPTKHLVINSNFTVLGTVAANAAGFTNDVGGNVITLSGNGASQIEIDADWTLAADDIEIFFYAGTCNSITQIAAGQCSVIAHTTTPAKPQTLTVPNVNPGTYSIGLANFGPNNESGNYQVYSIY